MRELAQRGGDGRYHLDQRLQERDGGRPVSLRVQLNERELQGAIDADIEVELALVGTDFGDVDVEGADRIGLEALLLGSLAFQRG